MPRSVPLWACASETNSAAIIGTVRINRMSAPEKLISRRSGRRLQAADRISRKIDGAQLTVFLFRAHRGHRPCPDHRFAAGDRKRVANGSAGGVAGATGHPELFSKHNRRFFFERG